MQKAIIAALLSCICFSASAITISVKADIKDCAALGFTVGKQSHGGLGHEYSKSNMPIHSKYGFGYRRSLFGSNVTCYYRAHQQQKTQQYVKLSQDTQVILYQKAGRCWIKTGPLRPTSIGHDTAGPPSS